MELKKTPLYQHHKELNAKMVNFSGWILPVEYSGTLKEVQSVRTSCGMFDASHMGEIAVSGQGAEKFLGKLIPNKVSSISNGKMQYSLLLNESGGVIDDLMVYRHKNSFLCVVNAVNKDKVLNWFNDNLIRDTKVVDRSQRMALISLQGPEAYAVAGRVFPCISSLEYMSFAYRTYKGKGVFVSRSGYTGEDGFEIYPDWEAAGYLWDIFLKRIEGIGALPCGLGARDILRIEAGYPLWGHELDDQTNPYEACLGWVIKSQEDFIGKKSILKAKFKGVKRRRIGFVMKERAVPREGYFIYNKNKRIGVVTSGAYSPTMDAFIGMAYVESGCHSAGSEIAVEIRGRRYTARVSKWPFIKPGVKKIRTDCKIKN
ncbi:MAG: glycine cleavage system aminomethyltransferase GcvT [Candidatus Omnitrophota bacterium]